MSRKEILKHAIETLHCKEKDLMWSDKCRNPMTNYHHEDGTIKGSEGYYILRK